MGLYYEICRKSVLSQIYIYIYVDHHSEVTTELLSMVQYRTVRSYQVPKFGFKVLTLF